MEAASSRSSGVAVGVVHGVCRNRLDVSEAVTQRSAAIVDRMFCSAKVSSDAYYHITIIDKQCVIAKVGAVWQNKSSRYGLV